jgi:hypothetical protein
MMHTAPRCRARSKRTGKPCMAPAMANGRCHKHGGPSPIGRANGAFRYGRYTKKALEECAQAKLLRMQAMQEAQSGIGDRWWAKHLLDEAFKLETAWIDRFERIGPKPGRKPKHGKRPLFPDGYDCANPFNRGRFTAQAKAERAMTMRARREFPAGYSGAFVGGRFTRAARVASGRETAADRIVMARREAAAQVAFERASMLHERKPRKPMDPERAGRFTAMGL